MSEIDIDTLTGPAAPVEHCGKPMTWRGSSTRWEGEFGSGVQLTDTWWSCECGASLTALVRVPT